MTTDTLPYDPTAPKQLPKPGPRKPLSKFDFATKFLEQAGKCYLCGQRLVRGQIIDEHDPPRETMPADICDDLRFRKLACKPCAKVKTVGDQALIGHMRRVRGESGQVKRRKERGGSMIKSASEIQSRGFNKSLRKRMNQKVEAR